MCADERQFNKIGVRLTAAEKRLAKLELARTPVYRKADCPHAPAIEAASRSLMTEDALKDYLEREGERQSYVLKNRDRRLTAILAGIGVLVTIASFLIQYLLQ